MKKWTLQQLLDNGFEIQNVQITDVSLNMKNYGCLTLEIGLEGEGWSCYYGGYCLGKGYVGASDDSFRGSAKGLESIMRIMDTVGVSDLSDMKSKYVRAVSDGWGSTIKIIGNITKDKWFDYGSFFEEMQQ